MKKSLFIAVLILLAARAYAFNADPALALQEPAQTLVEANKQIDAERAKCPSEYRDGSVGTAYFHLKKGEWQGVQDDHTAVKGYVCMESVTTPFQRAQMFVKAWALAGGAMTLLVVIAGLILGDTWLKVRWLKNNQF